MDLLLYIYPDVVGSVGVIKVLPLFSAIPETLLFQTMMRFTEISPDPTSSEIRIRKDKV